MMEVLTPPIWKTSTCLTLPSPVLTTFCRLEEFGLEAVKLAYASGEVELHLPVNGWARSSR